jgi:hypothetical protein
MTVMLADHVSVLRRFRRSVRVGADTGAAEIEGFVCTATAAQALDTTIDHAASLGHTAFTWTGPYGCGKSTLAVVLAAALGKPGKAREQALAALPEDLRRRLPEAMRWSRPGWRVIPVVGRRADAATVIAEALPTPQTKSSEIVRALVALSASEPCGVLLIIDEMGKLLEHAATEGGDAYFFQELAEAAARSEGRLMVVGVLHQAFDDYAYRLARETRDDWLKIQGRFVDIPLSPTAEEQVELLSRAIVAQPPGDCAAIDAVAAVLSRGGQQTTAAERLRRCWPLNPVVACLLGPLSRRRFGQNQRSIFGFLGSAEPFGFQDFLKSTEARSNTLYDATWLWSYLRANLEPSILASPDGHRWSIAVDAVERVEERGGDELEITVLKTVALLDLFRERSGLSASPELVAAALQLPIDGVAGALDSLARRSAIVFRRHLGAYAIYAGSDFDIEAAMDEVRTEMLGCDYSRLRATGVLTPILAKREYHETGAMRWFEVDVATLDQAEQRVASFRSGDGAAGLFLLLINESGDSAARVRRVTERLVDQVGDRPIAFGLSADSYMLRELSHELVALERVQATRPELKGDAVARREVAMRLARVAGELEERLRSGLSSTSWTVPAISTDELRTSGPAGLSAIASRMAAALYPQAPRIKNELVNRSKPSSNAMAAVRALMVAMAVNSGEHRLGIKDYPAEGGLYASVLERTGLHGQSEDGGYAFLSPRPGQDGHRLLPLWTAARDLLEQRGSDGMGLDNLFALWRARPFGLKDGLLPVLGLAFLLAERGRASVYLDGVFCSSISDLLVDRLLQDASSVRLRLSEISEHDAAILRGVADTVARYAPEDEPIGADPLAIGRQLVALVMNAPAWVRRTSRLGRAALRVRDLALSAHDPNKFMLDDLPKVAGKNATADAVIADLRKGLEELAGAYAAMLASLRDLLLRELRVRGEGGSERLRRRAKAVMGVTGNYRLDAFAARLSTYDESREAIEGIASLAANRPPRDWVDRDVDAARIELASLAREFLRAEGLAHVQGRGDGRFSFALFMSDPARPGLLTPEVAIDGEELDRARALAQSLRAVIGAKVGRDVALAAAAELVAALAEEADLEPSPALAVGGAR